MMKRILKIWSAIILVFLLAACKKEMAIEKPMPSLEIGIDGSLWEYDHYDAVVGNQEAGGQTGEAGLVKVFSLHIGVTDTQGATDYPLNISVNTLNNISDEGIKIGNYFRLGNRSKNFCVEGESELIFDCEGVVATFLDNGVSYQLDRKQESLLTLTDCDPNAHIISGQFKFFLMADDESEKVIEGLFTGLPYLYLPD